MRNLFRYPDAKDWMEAALVAAFFCFFATLFGLATGFYEWSPQFDRGLVRTGLIALIAPALLEEVIFRGPLIWLSSRFDAKKLWIAGSVLLVLFVLWHPLNAAVNMTAAWPIFTDWRFLILAAGLGVACSIVAVRSRSLIPAIALHWLLVVGWKAFFGAPTLL